jgi:hypothetical protein
MLVGGTCAALPAVGIDGIELPTSVDGVIPLAGAAADFGAVNLSATASVDG